MTGIWLIVWAIHGLPAISAAHQLNTWGIWLCITGALDFIGFGKGVLRLCQSNQPACTPHTVTSTTA